MNGMWSSSRPKGWPRHGFQKRGGAIFFGLVATFAAWFVQWQYQWDGMQRYYLAHYVVSSAGWFNKYLVLHTVDRRGKWHPTIPDEVVPVQMATYTHGVIPFRLSDAAIKTGAVKLANPLIAVDKARFARPPLGADGSIGIGGQLFAGLLPLGRNQRHFQSAGHLEFRDLLAGFEHRAGLREQSLLLQCLWPLHDARPVHQ
ncbi:MAG: hypothetical protein ABSG13_30570 [Bryobacteraceae bacterium]